MSEVSQNLRPLGLVVASVTTAALAAFTVLMAVLSLTSGHGWLSGGVALMLLLWGAGVGAAAWGLWRGSAWARGPVVAIGLLHLTAYGQFSLNQPLALVGAALALVAVIGAVLPATTRALRLSR
jgi:hypothetical protein